MTFFVFYKIYPMRSFSILLLLLASFLSQAQEFTRADTLRGTLSPLRSCFDVTYYYLHVEVDIDNKNIAGYNDIYFDVVEDFSRLQIDLFEHMNIRGIDYEGTELKYEREFNAVFVDFPRTLKKGEKARIRVNYDGAPIVAKNAPWDGGFVWAKDKNENDWVGVACEGMGASSWWPNKDHLSDEPDSMTLSFAVPKDLVCVANGRLREKRKYPDNMAEYIWHVSYPINNYNVTMNIGKYSHFSETYTAEDGSELDCDYYVLPYNVEKAKKQFKQVEPMMRCFEQAFGKYPFWNDGYKLVETPYLGMEHQGAIAYGNKYKPGYMGTYPGDMDFDYIIIHETGHEWWGNSVSMNDLADMWIHESFCTYSEAVYVECMYGYDKMLDYLMSQKIYISNGSPIVGTFGVNQEGNSTDMYYKGAWVLHTLRTVVDNDKLWKETIKGIATEFERTNVDGSEIIAYFNEKLGEDYSWYFDQYLYHSAIPAFEYKFKGGLFGKGKFSYRWDTDNEEFKMPLKVSFGEGTEQTLKPVKEWQTLPLKKKEFKKLSVSKKHYLIRMRQAN